MNNEKNRLKEWVSLEIPVIGLLGTIFTFFVQAIVITYETSRYHALGIPLYFIKQNYESFDMIRTVYLFVAVLVAIVVTVLLDFYTRNVEAYMEFEQIFHTEKLPKKDYYLWKIQLWLTVLASLFSANQVVISIFLIREEWKKATGFVLLFVCELLIAKFAVFLITEYRKDKLDDHTAIKKPYPAFKPYNAQDRQRIVPAQELDEAYKKYKINHGVLSHKQIGLVMTGSFAMLLLFICVQSSEHLNPIDKRCQIVREDGRDFVILTAFDNECIISPVKIDKSILYVYNDYQIVKSLSNLCYELKVFDKIELTGKEQQRGLPWNNLYILKKILVSSRPLICCGPWDIHTFLRQIARLSGAAGIMCC